MYKSIDKWLPPLLFKNKSKIVNLKISVFISVCDHFEPFHQTNGDRMLAVEKMKAWIQRFPDVQKESFDSIGRMPRHTFFYPIEQYDNEIVDLLEKLCRNGAGEVEVHLHHNDDTFDSLVEKLLIGKDKLAGHGLLPVDNNSQVRYGFIHGNWAITNSHPSGKYCGVENEISALLKTGCYADFTMPSVPDPCQSRIINSIYFAEDQQPSRSHDFGECAKVGTRINSNKLLFIQGVINLNWKKRKYGVLPRIENSDLTLNNPPNIDRFNIWKNAHIHVHDKPEWVFIKLHTHGCNPRNIEMHLGGLLQGFYSDLTSYCHKVEELDLYFVTAREMANLILAAVNGVGSTPQDCMDYAYKSLVS